MQFLLHGEPTTETIKFNLTLFTMNTMELTNRGAEVSALAPSTGSSNINVGTSERVISALGGAALTLIGLRNIRSHNGISMLISGSYLLVRGLTGYCALNNALGRNTVQKHSSPVEIETTVSLNKPRSEVYSYWRKLENLPRFMKHLEKVEEVSDTKSEWTAKLPGGAGTVSWGAEIVEDHFNELISWRSLPGSTIDNAGQVSFKDGLNNETEIKVRITYRLPGGDIGSIAAKLFSPVARKIMIQDIRDFKSIMETGMATSNIPLKKKKGKRHQEVNGNH